jgi:ABC-type nitrate/sulfonate/bicarbonate transport system substrate-binding protein
MRRWNIALLALLLAACGTAGQDLGSAGNEYGATGGEAAPAASAPAAPTSISDGVETPPLQGGSVTVGLDWTPNTNHSGLYLAQQQGFYEQNGLDVEILQAQEGGTVEQLVAAGRLQFGVSYQEAVTQARAEGLPIVSVAAVIQHNTSGFASRADAGITTPRDFEGKKYGSFGSPIEQAVIEGLMDCAGADASKVEFVDIGATDFFVASERGDVDFAWVFEGWTGIEAQQRGVDLNIVMINDQQCVPDYYTPVLITSEDTIAQNPDMVRAFLRATSQGYGLAIDSPDAAAAALLKAAPELDAELVKASQQYLAAEYQAEAPRWGEQRLEVWRDYAQWMADRALIPAMIEPEQAFTNEFLP